MTFHAGLVIGLLIGAIGPMAWLFARSAIRQDERDERYVTHWALLTDALAYLQRGRMTTQALGYIRALSDALEDALADARKR